jgi:hypothetical protein
MPISGFSALAVGVDHIREHWLNRPEHWDDLFEHVPGDPPASCRPEIARSSLDDRRTLEGCVKLAYEPLVLSLCRAHQGAWIWFQGTRRAHVGWGILASFHGSWSLHTAFRRDHFGDSVQKRIARASREAEMRLAAWAANAEDR